MYLNERYFIDEEKKVVVCKLTNCAGSLICDMCHKDWPAHPAMEIADEFVGKAKLHPDDTFDIEKGKKIALRRATAKLAKAKARALQDFLEGQLAYVGALTADANKLLKRYEYNIDKKDADIQYIINAPATAEEN